MKIIITNKFKEHIKVHQDDFTVDALELIRNSMERLKNNIKGQQTEQITLKYDFTVGSVGVVEAKDNDIVIWKKRKGYSDYSRFVIGKQKPVTNMVTFILNKSYTSDDYFLLTCFPSLGIEVKKEMFDKRINSLEEFMDSRDFWLKYAFVENNYPFIDVLKDNFINRDNMMATKYANKLIKRLDKLSA